MARIYFHARCERCGTYQDADHDRDGHPSAPVGWAERSVIPSWAFGATKETVLLCRSCTGAVDTAMKEAWSDALKSPPMPAPSKEPPP